MLFSPNQLLLCKLFAFYPERIFYMQEIGRILEKKPGVFQRMLNILEKEGFVKSKFQANARFFQLNPDYPILKEIQSILKKTSPDNPFKEKVTEQSRKTRGRKKLPNVKLQALESPQENKESSILPSLETAEPVAPKMATRFSDLHKEKILTHLNINKAADATDSDDVDSEQKLKKHSRKSWQKYQMELF